jgi:hypothetical protein
MTILFFPYADKEKRRALQWVKCAVCADEAFSRVAQCRCIHARDVLSLTWVTVNDAVSQVRNIEPSLFLQMCKDSQEAK